jgi:hypothetical protein
MFDGFALDDFDAYLPDRAGSNMYNGRRLTVLEKMRALLREAEPRVAATLGRLESATSDHAPSLRNNRNVDAQWGFLRRDESERLRVEEVIEGSRGIARRITDPPSHQQHAVIAAVADARGLFTGLRVSGHAMVDAANLAAVLADPDACEPLCAAIRALPEPFAVHGPEPEDPPVPAGEISPARLHPFRRALADDSGAFFELGRRRTRAEAAAAGSGLLAVAAAELEAVVDVYRRIAWSPDNDRIGFDALLERVRAERAHEEEQHDREQRSFAERKATAAEAARERLDRLFQERAPGLTRGDTREVALPIWAPVPRRERRDGTSEPAPPDAPQRPAAAGDERTDREPPVRPEPRPEAEAAAPPAPRPEAREPRRSSEPRGTERRREPDDGRRREPRDAGDGRESPVPGDLVRLLEGPLRGRVGTLFEVDPRGEARVMLGLLTTRIPLERLVPIPRRPRNPDGRRPEHA